MPSTPCTSFGAHLWMHLSIFPCFLDCGAQKCIQYPGEAAPWMSTVGWSPFLTGWWCCVWCTQDGVCSLGFQGTFWLMLALLSTRTLRSLSAGLCSSHSSPRLGLCLVLLCLSCRIRIFFFSDFMPFDSPFYLDPSARPLIPQKSQQQSTVWYGQQTN